MANYRLIERCRGCRADAKHFEVVLEMEPMPLAGQFCLSQDEAYEADVYPLTWIFCHGCGAVQVGEDVAGKSLFDTYNYASSTVPGLVRHFKSYAKFLSGRYGGDEPLRFLEIGCNDGVLLNELPDSWKRTGVDPSDVARRAVEQGACYELVSEPFTTELVQEQKWEGSWDVISGSNCLAHISDLREVFSGVATALKAKGWFWVEVHELEALLEGAQWDTIYHEHKVEWSVDSLKTCVESVGFELQAVERLPLHGGIIRCGFQRVADGMSAKGNETVITDDLRHLQSVYRSRHDVSAVRSLLKAMDSGESIVAYGASGRANVYLNQLPELAFDYIVDESPLRMNRFIPARGTPIVPPERLSSGGASACLVTAWNYFDDIVAKNTRYRGQWLRAFPVP